MSSFNFSDTPGSEKSDSDPLAKSQTLGTETQKEGEPLSWTEMVGMLVHASYASLGRNCPSVTVEIFSKLLRPYPIEEITEAFANYMATDETRQPPSPQSILSQLQGGSISERALRAWQEVVRSIRLIGPHRCVAFSDPITTQIVLEKGWFQLNTLSEQDLTFYAREFQKEFVAQAKSSVRTVSSALFAKGIQATEGLNLAGPFEVFCLNAPAVQKSWQSVPHWDQQCRLVDLSEFPRPTETLRIHAGSEKSQ